MRYNGVYAASETSQAITGADVLIEVQVPADSQIEIFRMWVGAAEGADPVAEVQEIDVYQNDAVATGGTGLQERILRGSDDSSTAAVTLGGPTKGATPFSLIPDGFHLQNGWLYLPTPEERIRVSGGGGEDNVGFRFPTAPDASITISYGVIWGELG